MTDKLTVKKLLCHCLDYDIHLNGTLITYKKYKNDIDHDDIFVGVCEYDSKANELISLDSGVYSLDDVIYDYDIEFKPDDRCELTVWLDNDKEK